MKRSVGGRPRRYARPLRSYVGAVVESLFELGNSLASVPAGTRFRVTSASRGINVETVERCEKCRIKLYIRQCAPENFRVIEEPANPSPPRARRRSSASSW